MRTRIACLNFEQIGRLLRTYALASAIQKNTRIEWKEYKESTVLNAVYFLMPWKEGPGWAEVNQDQQRIKEEALFIFNSCIDTLLVKIAAGPCEVLRYLSDIERLKDFCTSAVQEVFHDARQINAEVVGETTKAIQRLAAVKAASSITLAGLSGGVVLVGGSVALVGSAGAVSFGYSVTGAVVKNWSDISMAGALAIEISKEFGPKLVGGAASAIGTGQMWEVAPKWNAARERVQKLSEELARKVSEKQKRKVARKLTEAEADLLQAQAQAAKGYKLANIGKNIVRFAPVVFAATDILGAIDEYQTDTK